MQSSSSAPSRPAVRSQLSMSGSTVAAGSNDDRSSGDQGWQAEVALTTTAATRVPVTGAPLIGSRERSGVAVGTPSSRAAAAALFERGLDLGKRAQLGAHYTDRDKIMLLVVEPVVIRRPVQIRRRQPGASTPAGRTVCSVRGRGRRYGGGSRRAVPGRPGIWTVRRPRRCGRRAGRVRRWSRYTASCCGWCRRWRSSRGTRSFCWEIGCRRRRSTRPGG